MASFLIVTYMKIYTIAIKKESLHNEDILLHGYYFLSILVRSTEISY